MYYRKQKQNEYQYQCKSVNENHHIIPVFSMQGKIYYTIFLYFNYQLRSYFCTKTNYDCH